MKRCIKSWFFYLKNVFFVVSTLIGFIFVFLPLPETTTSNIKTRVLIIAVILALAIIASIVWMVIDSKQKSKKLYEKGKTKVFFEYGKLEEVLESVTTNDDSVVTFVIPINSNLEVSSNIENIKQGTTHHWALEQIGINVDINFISGLKQKSDGFDKNGKKGDWFLVTKEESKIDKNVQFLFLEVFDIENRNGKWQNADLLSDDYLAILQKCIIAIYQNLDYESKVYMPLIGAGAGNVAKPEDIMQLLANLLKFNRGKLRHEVHVLIDGKYRKDTPICQLIEF